MEPESSLPPSQQPATCHYTESGRSSPYSHPTSRIFVLILSSHLSLGLPSGLIPSGFPSRMLYAPLQSPIRAKINVSCGQTKFLNVTSGYSIVSTWQQMTGINTQWTTRSEMTGLFYSSKSFHWQLLRRKASNKLCNALTELDDG